MLTDSLPKQGIIYFDSKDSQKSQVVVRRKPGRPPKQHPPGTINGVIAECAVCHDKATGLHYAVMTCEGCKGFFKRSIQAEKHYKCRNKEDCSINKDSRNACQACRMKRCFNVGMQEKLVRDDRTPGNRKKKYAESLLMNPMLSSDNSDNAADYANTETLKTIKQEGICMEPFCILSSDQYCTSNKKRWQDNYNTDYGGDLSAFNFGNVPFSANSLNHDMLCNNISPIKDFEDWELSLMAPDSMADVNTTDVIQHITSVCDQSINNFDNCMPLFINCSGDQDLPLKKCRLSPKCLMHLLTRLMKAKPVEPAFCKYFERYPTSEQFLDCLADEIHLIIKFAKKTPGFCELSMSRKLSVIQKHALSILFMRIIYRSLTCPMNHVQFASNICLNYNEFGRIEMLSSRFRQAIIELISSFKSLNLDIYELCLIQYVIIEDEDCDADCNFDKPSNNISQKYLKLYTTNKYPDQPHRWIFIMLSLTQIQEMVKLFTVQCLDMVNSQRMTISNDILKEILSI